MTDDAERQAMGLLARDQHSYDSRDQGPVPHPGRNDSFDEYVLKTFGVFDPNSGVDLKELRRAAWRTWRTAGPGSAGPSRPSEPEEDDELARALALSAEDFKKSQGSRNQPIVIDSDDDDDDGDVQLAIAASAEEENPVKQRREETPDEERQALADAIAASLQESKEDDEDSDAGIERANAAYQASREASRERQVREREARRGATVGLSSKALSVVSSTGPSPPQNVKGPERVPIGLSALVIDRAQLERERLARQAMRSGSSSGQPQAGRSVVPQRSQTQRTASMRLSNHPLQSRGTFPTDAAGEYYLDGELRHVRLQIGSSTTDSTFSPQSVFGQRDQIALVIVSAYCWDPDWIESFMPPPESCPTIRILRPPVNDLFERRRMEGKLKPLGNGEIQVYPRMDGKTGSEHMKFAWIWYKTGRLRVSVMTANMVDYDWEQIENTVFVQDFLPKGQALESAPAPDTALPDFPDQFRRLFAHLKVNKALTWHIKNHPRGQSVPISDDAAFSDFKKYNWSRVQVRLVMSVAGTYKGFTEMSEYGISRLGKILAEEGWQPRKDEKVVAEYQGSSLGRYSLDWYNCFYQLCCGKDLSSISRAGKALAWPPLKIIFPSLATVDASINGRSGGGTMFCGSAYTDRTKSLFHDANSKRGGMLIALFEANSSNVGFSSPQKQGKRKADEMTTENEGVGGWVYVGSHNFSPSAWGTVNFKNSPPTLNINNYELGIIFPLPRDRAETVANCIAAHKRPPRPYSKHDEPWDQKKYLP
ncbi:hypothetical protein CspeluHIS016_0102140 [Cutaneotrichosporon spelunceum]|uniref:Phospholipase D/nuclease n=1 Tax=Cutaneotrichosporon spelunceum TaxID=1672016 RepID=A0AAD3TN34_9TREE|nr:hypothetical protein CspeluHIS016_0102140 [Cutaneotrichosporon spelunceum]